MASVPHSLSHYIVFSYHKNHEELVFKVYQYLKGQNLPVWIDVEDGVNKDQYNRYFQQGKCLFNVYFLVFEKRSLVSYVS